MEAAQAMSESGAESSGSFVSASGELSSCVSTSSVSSSSSEVDEVTEPDFLDRVRVKRLTHQNSWMSWVMKE